MTIEINEEKWKEKILSEPDEECSTFSPAYMSKQALEKIENHLNEMRKTANYDWNADPLYITRIEGWLNEAKNY